MRSVRAKRLHSFVVIGERQRRHLLREFVEHYHQGSVGKLIRSPLLPCNDKCSRGAIAATVGRAEYYGAAPPSETRSGYFTRQ